MKLLICLMFAVIYCNIGVDGNHRFGYSPSEQRRWNKKHSHCSGKYQSPIAISVSKAIPLAMPAIEMIGYHNPLPGPLKMDNNGHSVGISIPKLSKEAQEMGEFLPYVKGGKLEGEYEVEALHFHWGDKNSRGAEHVVNDIRYAMEMHIIHRNKKYQDVKEAMTYPDGLSVLAFFFRTKEEDATDIGHITRYLTEVTKPGEEVLLNYTFSLSSMIGSIDLDRFYMYKGSLTTPPCSEAVTWILFPDPLAVSLSQISKFRHTQSSHEGNVLVDNYRKLQPLGNRRVFLRKINPRYQSIEDPEIHYSKWGWLS